MVMVRVMVVRAITMVIVMLHDYVVSKEGGEMLQLWRESFKK